MISKVVQFCSSEVKVNDSGFTMEFEKMSFFKCLTVNYFLSIPSKKTSRLQKSLDFM